MPDTSLAIGGAAIRYSSRTNIGELVDEFKTKTAIRRIVAFSGGADSGLGEDTPTEVATFLEERMRREIGQAVRFLRGYNIAVLTGGTSFGVPAVAAQVAKEAGLATIGVFPLVGSPKALPGDVVDLRICVEPRYGESCWGDESPIFAKLLDGVIVYGGNAGTLVEAAHLLKINEARLKKRLAPKYIVPVTGSGGTADTLPFFPAKIGVRSASMPGTSVTTAREAARVLAQKLNLDDFVKDIGEAT